MSDNELLLYSLLVFVIGLSFGITIGFLWFEFKLRRITREQSTCDFCKRKRRDGTPLKRTIYATAGKERILAKYCPMCRGELNQSAEDE